jgi:hypothetical protein
VLRRIFEPTKEEVRKGWRKLNNENFRILYTSPNIIRVIKLKGIGYSVQVVCTEDKRGASTFLSNNLKHMDDMGKDDLLDK